ncbi:MAG: NAD-dependent epimerase/dehydratase family protein [Bacteroidales bacterium]|nr:NAD-dependent epimerase/dehydratase family protein [Bacteroidales bacterium]
MKLLIVGGTGVLSSAVVAEAIAQKIEVTIITRGIKKKEIPGGVTYIKADYRNREMMLAKLEGKRYDAVIDFICYNRKQIDYSIELLHRFADQYVFISTACVYDSRVQGVKDENADKVLPDWNYSVQKWECECFLKGQAEKLGFNYTVVRPCVTYDDTRIPYGVMPLYGYHWTFCARILSGKPVLRWDGGNARWNMMRVEDFAVGLLGVIGNPHCYGEAYNISGDNSYSWNEVLHTLGELLGKDPTVFDVSSEEFKKYYPDRKGEIAGRSLDLIVSNNKVKGIVPSFGTTYSLKAGLQRTLEAYEGDDYQLGIDWKYDAAMDRVIKVLSKKRGLSTKQFNLGFNDYLGTATSADRRVYWLEFHRDNPMIKASLLGARFFGKIVRSFKNGRGHHK